MKINKLLSAVIVASVMFSCNKKGASKESLKTEIDSVSYAIGMDVARNAKTSFSEINSELFMEGFMSVIDSSEVLIDQDKAQEVISVYFQKKQEAEFKKQQEEALKKVEETYAENKAAGVKFLEENKSKEGVKVTSSGLQYIVLKEGSGPKPTTNNKVKVHYHGTLIDGTVFESSVENGAPAEFFVTQVVQGWIEGLQLMPVGSKYKFFVPQELAYGAFPRQGGGIKPFDTLIFEIELLEIIQ